ncbi:LGALS1 [Cervus elaphus hippelaphus]|uniref:Galectin n=1 Tax=Cervus elaphus hippelaphus TaxID=46360 RepID=A0A212CCP9_CEREH|nr:LGALS1 [Cervus elaphus hippelaphus]
MGPGPSAEAPRAGHALAPAKEQSLLNPRSNSRGTLHPFSCLLWGLVASNLNLKPGECLRVRGEVAADAKSFSLNLGKDDNNLCLHFNPRFDAHGDINTIVCISFNQTDLTIKLPDGYEFKFPNRLNLEAINYLAAGGDFKIKCVAFE